VALRTSRAALSKNVAVLTGGAVTGQLALLVTLPALTRLYSPDEMGQFGLLVSFVTFASVLTSLRYEMAIVSADHSADAANLTVAAIALSVPVSIAFALVLSCFQSMRLFGFHTLPAWSRWAALVMLLTTQAFLILRYWCLREEWFGYLARVNVYQNLARATCPIVLHVIAESSIGLVAGDALGRLAGLGSMSKRFWNEGVPHSRNVRRNTIWKVLKKYYRFPLFQLPSSVINNLALSAPIPLILHYYGADAAGYFALVQRLLQAPAVLIGRSTADAVHARAAVYARTDTSKIAPLFWHTTLMLSAVAFVAAAAVVLASGQAFVVAFGPEWRRAGQLAIPMLPWAIASLVVSSLSRLAVVLDGQKAKLIYDTLSLASVVLVIVLSHRAAVSLTSMIWYLSTTQAVAYAVYYAILANLVFRSPLLNRAAWQHS
jgi:lipopolysaccharide exporter